MQRSASASTAGADGRPLVLLRDVTKCYRDGDRDVQALRGVSLTIGAGEFVIVQGPSGSGKSTLLHIIGTIEGPTSGEVTLDGRDVVALAGDDLAEVRNRSVGFIFQRYNLLMHASVFENVETPLLYSRPLLAAAQRHDCVMAALETVGMAVRAKSRSAGLSGGEQQRVAIARALVMEPPLLLADEPTGALDSGTGQDLLELLQTLNADRGVTIALVTHDPQIARFGSRLIEMRDGVITADRTVAP